MATFGSYEVLETVATGSTGTVYRAIHRDIGRVAAIKQLSPEVRAVPGLVDRFRAEAHTLAELDSPHVVSIFDFVEEPDRVWIAEEWVDGVTIETMLRAAQKLSAEQALGVLRGALLGLAHAHERGVVHRDIAPSNIIADRAGTSMLIDFGLAAPVGLSGRCGTPAFMSPEAVAGAPITEKSDVYSAAAVLFTLLAGSVPFPGRTVDEVMHAHVSQPPPRLDGHGPAMTTLLLDAMAKDPAARPPDADAFLARLEVAAQERYGAGWLERSSIAGLVTIGTAGVAAVSATAAGAGATAATGVGASTSYLDAVASTGAAVARRSRISRPWLIGAAVTTVAALGVVSAIAFTGNDAKSPLKPTQTGGQVAGGRLSSAASTTAALTRQQLLEASAPKGVYQLDSVIVASNYLGDSVGKHFLVKWTITLSCTGASCTGAVSSTSGSHFTATYDGKVLVGRTTQTQSGPCVYKQGPKKGKTDPTTHFRDSTVSVFTLTVTASAPSTPPTPGIPTAFSGGGIVATSKPTVSGVCTADIARHRTLSVTATLVR